MVPFQPAVCRAEVALGGEIEVLATLVEGGRRRVVPAVGDRLVFP